MPTREELPEFVRQHQLGRLARRTTASGQDFVATEGDYDADTEFVDDPADAEVVLSCVTSPVGEPHKLATGGEIAYWLDNQPKHRPIIDLDIPAALVPSSTPGHGHLYIDVELSWSQYARLLGVLADCGIIERGYYDASYARQFTSVRMPSVRKNPAAVSPPQ